MQSEPTCPAVTPAGGAGIASKAVLAGCVLVAGAGLAVLAFTANVKHACENLQWPVSSGCHPSIPVESTGPAGTEWDRLRERVARNPGDGLGVAAMARYAGLPGETIGLDGGRLLDLAVLAAPNRDEVLKQVAVRSLSGQDWGRAVPVLVQLAERHGDAEAARSLAKLVVLASQDVGLRGALRRAAESRGDWLDRALRAVAAEKLPMWATLPLVSELLPRDVIKPATGLLMVRQLKSEGRWLDAHAVWLQLWKRPLDLIYNGSFDREFVRDTFDWDVAEGDALRVGAEIERVGMGPRGQVLRFRFNGRPLRVPLIRHDLVLPAGQYHFEGDFRAKDFQGVQGFLWSMKCLQDGRELSRSEVMHSTGAEWVRSSMELTTGSDCHALSLTLFPSSESDLRAGMRGELWLDRVVLTRQGGAATGGAR